MCDAPITMFRITDDPIANAITAQKLLAYYPNAPHKLRVIAPHEVGVDRIGHAGFFSGKFRDTLWQECLHVLEMR
jgi:predicted alpha/beta hydrolase